MNSDDQTDDCFEIDAADIEIMATRALKERAIQQLEQQLKDMNKPQVTEIWQMLMQPHEPTIYEMREDIFEFMIKRPLDEITSFLICHPAKSHRAQKKKK